jgi:hypothetical protein
LIRIIDAAWWRVAGALASVEPDHEESGLTTIP